MCAAVLAAMTASFVAGCGGEGEGKQSSSPATPNSAASGPSAERVAALERDVAKLRADVQQLRHRIEMGEKMRQRQDGSQFPHRPGVRTPEDLRKEEFRMRQSTRRNDLDVTRKAPPEGWQDPATMTPEQRRAWHEERRKLREEKRRKMLEEVEAHKREKISESGKQETANTRKENK